MEEGSYRYKVARRLLTCRACPTSVRTPGIGLTCGKFLHITPTSCGCILAIKARLLSFHCPIKKW